MKVLFLDRKIGPKNEAFLDKKIKVDIFPSLYGKQLVLKSTDRCRHCGKESASGDPLATLIGRK